MCFLSVKIIIIISPKKNCNSLSHLAFLKGTTYDSQVNAISFPFPFATAKAWDAIYCFLSLKRLIDRFAIAIAAKQLFSRKYSTSFFFRDHRYVRRINKWIGRSRWRNYSSTHYVSSTNCMIFFSFSSFFLNLIFLAIIFFFNKIYLQVNTRQQTERDLKKEKRKLGTIEQMCQVSYLSFFAIFLVRWRFYFIIMGKPWNLKEPANGIWILSYCSC